MRAALPGAAASWLNAALALVYPENCQLCGQARATPAEGYVCAACRKQIRLVEPPFCAHCGCPFSGAITTEFECANCREMRWQFRYARSAAIARDQLLEIIHLYKYSRALWFEPLLADLLIRPAQPDLRREDWDWLVPVPLHPTRQREREFNQAERLARRLSTATGIPLHPRLLRRALPTRSQTLLSREERLENVRKAFALRRGVGELQGRRVVLIDDVLTTGATTSACAGVLRSAGVADVCVWTVARGI